MCEFYFKRLRYQLIAHFEISGKIAHLRTYSGKKSAEIIIVAAIRQIKTIYLRQCPNGRFH